MKKIPYWPLAIFALLVTVIALTNYFPGTWLAGWDNLLPEFNFGLNIRRTLFAVWQEYQGTGLLGGMGHAADLPRQIFLWFLSFVFPANTLRYIYHFLMLFIGTTGAYMLLRNFVFPKHPYREQIGLIGGISYLCNLATVQMFYVPFEPFSHHFAFLPWILWSNLNFLENKNRKSLVWLIAIAILAIPQGFVPTYFIVTVMALAIVYLGYLFKKRAWKAVIIALSVCFFINAYWLLPNIHYVLTKASVTVNAKINQMSTEDNFLKNKKYGNLADTMLFRGFWFDNAEVDSSGQTRFLMDAWIQNNTNPFIYTIEYGIFACSLAGVALTVYRKKFTSILFIPLFLLSFTVIANDAPVFSQLAKMFYRIPLFSQVFRFPFTKFSILLALCVSLFYPVVFADFVTQMKKRSFRITLYAILGFAPIIAFYPAFTGHFFSPINRMVIPDDYFEVFDFFRTQNKTDRIANFPQYTYWGWSIYRWGYRGSGLLWYGIEQPILDRAFDVWGKENEQYYHEISYALYSGNQPLFENILEKYQIRWLLVDDSIASFANQKEIEFSKLSEILKNSPKIHPEKKFGNIRIFRVDISAKATQNVILTNNQLPAVGPVYQWNNNDTSAGEYPYYESSNTPQDNAVWYPFRSLFTGRNPDEREFTITDNGEYYSFSAILPEGLRSSTLSIPAVEPIESTRIDAADLSKTPAKMPQILIDNSIIDIDLSASSSAALPQGKQVSLEIRIPKIDSYYSYDTATTSALFTAVPKSCNSLSKGIYKHTIVRNDLGEKTLRLTSVNSNNCIDIDVPALSQQLGYVMTIDSRHIDGKGLLAVVVNKTSLHADIETYIPIHGNTTSSFFVIPPMQQDGIGFTIHLDNISYGRQQTINDISKVTIYPIPYHFLTGIKVTAPSDTDESIFGLPITVLHPNPSIYTVDGVGTNPDQYLILTQAYDPGWHAYEVECNKLTMYCLIQQNIPFLFGKELTNHVLINSWANGWKLNQTAYSTPPAPGDKPESTIVIFFLPQLLEYAGFVLFGIPFLLIPFMKKNTKIEKTLHMKAR